MATGYLSRPFSTESDVLNDFEDELLSDESFRRLSKQRQSELIGKHCAGIEEKIRSSTSPGEAECIAADACRKFEDECPSALILDALKSRLEHLIGQYWKRKYYARAPIQR
jgi:hypothetical protein